MYALKFSEGPLAGSFFIRRLPDVDAAFRLAAVMSGEHGHIRVFHLGTI